MKSRERLIEAYVGELPLTAILILTTDGGVKLARTKRSERANEASLALWCDDRFLDIIITNVRGRMRGAEQLDAAQLEQMIRAAAEELGVPLQTVTEMRATADAAVTRVIAQFDEMMRGGELRELNRRYRDERLSRGAAGEGIMRYAAWLKGERVRIVKLAAALVSGSHQLAGRIAEA